MKALDLAQKLTFDLLQLKEDGGLNALTGDGLENQIKKSLPLLGYDVFRTDFKNSMPDFLIARREYTNFTFLECKNYTTHTTLKSAKKASKSNGTKMKQHLKRQELARKYNVIVLWMLKDSMVVEDIYNA